jgi:glutathione S-transferase
VGTAERAHFYKWLAWIATTLQAEMQLYFYPDRWGDEAAAAQIRTHAERRMVPMFDQLDAQFARHGGPWFAGERFSALDPYLLTMCRWSRGMERPARTLPQLGPYLQRMLARPAVQRVFAREGLSAPLV